MARNDQPGRRRWFPVCRKIFRWCRIGALTLLLAGILAALYLHLVGLPEFLKRPLLTRLTERGFDVRFDRLRLTWFWGLVLENPSFTGTPGLTNSPILSAAEIEFGLNATSVLRRQPRVDSVHIRNGRITQPLSPNNPLPPLVLDQIDAAIVLQNNRVQVDQFHARFREADLVASGSLTNISAIGDVFALVQHSFAWTLRAGLSSTNQAGPPPFDRAASLLEQFRWSGQPKVNLLLSGDAADLGSLKASLLLTVPSAISPWGNVTNVTLKIQPNRRMSGQNQAMTELQLLAESARILPWGQGRNFKLLMEMTPSSTNRDLAEAEITMSVGGLTTLHGHADLVSFNGQASVAWTNTIPTHARGRLTLDGIDTPWVRVRRASLALRYGAAATISVSTAWPKLDPIELDFDADVTDLETRGQRIERMQTAGEWRSPNLEIKRLAINLMGGMIESSAGLNLVTREARGQFNADFDTQKLAPLLSTNGQQWLNQFGYDRPPRATGSLRLILPPWTTLTNQTMDWPAEILPSLEMGGSFNAGRSSFRGVVVDSATGTFQFTNQTWHLPDIHLVRPEGALDLEIEEILPLKHYRFRFVSHFDPKIVRPLLPSLAAQHAFDLAGFDQPPLVEGEIAGLWHDAGTIGATARLLATNITYRGEHADRLESSLSFTNQMITLTGLRLDRDGRMGTSPRMEIDLAKERIFFHEVVGAIDPYAVTRAIGPKTAAAVEAYRFDEPPLVKLNGSIPFRDNDGADLHFEVTGRNFHWKDLRADSVNGLVHWEGRYLTLTNLQATGYRNGTMGGWVWLDFAPSEGADFRFTGLFTNLDLSDLTAPFRTGTNRLDGSLSGSLNVVSANSARLDSWQGHGQLELTNGFIWEIPIFGLVSPFLNTLSPGMGNSRAREATTTYVLSNSVFYSENLEIKSTGFRIQYRGSVDFQQRVHARVEAEPLRDVWLFGRLLSLGFSPLSKLFEFRVTGTLGEPKSDPIYVPKMFMWLLHPVRTVQDIFETKPSPGTGPAPPPEAPPKTE